MWQSRHTIEGRAMTALYIIQAQYEEPCRMPSEPNPFTPSFGISDLQPELIRVRTLRCIRSHRPYDTSRGLTP